MAIPPPNSDVAANTGKRDVPSASDVSTKDQLLAQAPTVSFVPANPETQVAPITFTFGPYAILHEIAHGGMGIVYRARHTVLERVVALKVIRSGLGASPELCERFLREARLVAGLKHRHIVNILDFGDVNGQLYFTMALAAGGSLSQHLQRFHADLRGAVTLMEKVSRAVQCIHDHGLLHRDLKPGNILLEDGDEPLVSDFGLARPVESADEFTQPGVVLGTVAYMSPEQASGDQRWVGPATDVWALGVILFELLCGRKPFVGADRPSLLEAIRTADPPAPRSLSPRLPRPLETILLKCLEKESARRYPSAGALADDLGCWLRGEPIKAQPLTRLGKARRWAGRNPRKVAVTLALPLIAAALILALQSFDPDRVWTNELQPRLDNGEPVTLIDSTGPPRWSRWELSGKLDASRPNEPLSVNTGALSLLVLAPDPRCERFELRAEVLHEFTSRVGNGEVGLFLCHTKHIHAITGGDVHCFLALRFADWGSKAIKKELKKTKDERVPEAKKEEKKTREVKLPELEKGDFVYKPIAKIKFEPVHYFEGDEVTNPFNRAAQTKVQRQFIPHEFADLKNPSHGARKVQRPAADWRQLIVKVSPEQIAVFWGKEPDLVGVLTRKELNDKARSLLLNRPDMAGANPEFPARGALGLFVLQSAASFRNVVLEPSKD